MENVNNTFNKLQDRKTVTKRSTIHKETQNDTVPTPYWTLCRVKSGNQLLSLQHDAWLFFTSHTIFSYKFIYFTIFMQVERIFSFEDECKGEKIQVRIPEVQMKIFLNLWHFCKHFCFRNSFIGLGVKMNLNHTNRMG